MRRKLPALLSALLLAACGAGTPAAEQGPPAPPAEASGEREAVIAVVGDLMVHEEQLWSARDPDTGSYDFSPGFRWVAEDLAAADLAIGNLETVFGGEAAGYAGYPRFNTPDSFAAALKEAGFDFLSTANNHCLDQGDEGLLRTLEVLDEAGIGHTGTFPASAESRVSLVEANGIRIALASFTYGTNDQFPAGAGRELAQGPDSLVNRLDRDTVRAVLLEAAGLDPDWIIALPHMGDEYSDSPGPVYRQWADFMLSCGADAVLAAHPHVLQPLAARELEAGEGASLTAYSLGNFLAFQQEPPADTGVILKLRIVKDGEGPARLREASVLPVWTQHREADGRTAVRALPLRDAIGDYEDGNSLRLPRQSYSRLLQAHGEATALLLGEPLARSSLQREYVVYSAP